MSKNKSSNKRAQKKRERNSAKRKKRKKEIKVKSLEFERKRKEDLKDQQVIYREKREAEDAGKKEILDKTMPSKPVRPSVNAAELLSRHMNMTTKEDLKNARQNNNGSD